MGFIGLKPSLADYWRDLCYAWV